MYSDSFYRCKKARSYFPLSAALHCIHFTCEGHVFSSHPAGTGIIYYLYTSQTPIMSPGLSKWSHFYCSQDNKIRVLTQYVAVKCWDRSRRYICKDINISSFPLIPICTKPNHDTRGPARLSGPVQFDSTAGRPQAEPWFLSGEWLLAKEGATVPQVVLATLRQHPSLTAKAHQL